MRNKINYSDFAATLEFPPTDEQAEVITSQAPSILVIAGAGSGKTTTMSQRIAWKIVSGQVRPEQVLGLTFTNKAASELAESTYSEIENARKTLRLVHATENDAENNNESTNDLVSQLESEDLFTANLDARSRADADSRQEDLEQKAVERNRALDQIATNLHEDLLRPTISTYNAFASEIAGSYAMLIGEDPRARLINQAERWQIMEKIVQELEISAEFREILREKSDSADTAIKVSLNLAAAIIDNLIDIETLREYLENEIQIISDLEAAGNFRGKPFTKTEASKGFAKLKDAPASLKYRLAVLPYVEAYFKYKRENSLIEFADQISWATRILQAAPEVGKKLREQYKLILLDEYQDTSVNQALFLSQAFKGAESVCAVGDPNQAIYGWRGASANALVDFVKQFNVAKNHQLTLYTSFRNPRSVLRVANRITQGFAQEVSPHLLYEDFNEIAEIGRPWIDEPIVPAGKAALELPILKAQPKAINGNVIHVHRHLRSESYQAMAAQIAKDFAVITKKRFANSDSTAPTGAVLVRANKHKEDVAAALKAAGLEYEIVGGTPVITMPEIRAIRSLLKLSVSDTCNDSLVYLFNYFALGAADINAFADLRRLVKQKMAAESPDKKSQHANLMDVFAIFEAELNSEDSKQNRADNEFRTNCKENAAIYAAAKASITSAGIERINYIATCVAKLKENRNLQIPIMIQKSVELLQLPILIASRIEGQAKIRSAINIFSQLSADYCAADTGRKLAGFLSWIDEVEAQENVGQEKEGDDSALVEVLDGEVQIPGKVTILTIHAAKGLQWDVVAIPELVAGGIDTGANKGLAPWHTTSKKFPDPLRADADYIPYLSIQDISFCSEDLKLQKGEAACRYYDYLNRKLPKYYSDEQRRLAYVAFTRPKYSLILASHEYESRQKVMQIVEKSNTKTGSWQPAELSTFLNELLSKTLQSEKNEPDYCIPDPGNEPIFATKEEFQTWAETLNNSTSSENQANTAKYWPRDVNRELISPEHKDFQIPDEKSAAALTEISSHILLLNAETNESTQLEQEIPYFTASGIVSLISDAETFIRMQQRPIPTEPNESARRGALVHAKIAQYFEKPQYFNIDEIAGPNEMKIDPELIQEDRKAQKLFTRFTQSRFANLKPIAIEQSVELVIAGIPVRCVIDAVFDTTQIPDAPPVTIVDWKTGKRPNQADIAARQSQLTLYRYAWSHSTGIPIDQIDTCFVYLGEDDTAKRELRIPPMNKEELETKIMNQLAHIGSSSKGDETQ